MKRHLQQGAGVRYMIALLGLFLTMEAQAYCNWWKTDDITVGSVWEVKSDDPYFKIWFRYSILDDRVNAEGIRYLKYEEILLNDGVKVGTSKHYSVRAKYFLCFGSGRIITRKELT